MHYQGQVGSEPTPQEFLEALWACTAEWMRVLKPSGSIFVNLGDKYVADNRGSGGDYKRGEAKYAPAGPAGFPGRTMARQKSLMLLPERYRIGCVDRLGLIARSVIIWDKPNGLPESVTDRVRRSHEDWVHLTLAPRYFSAIDEIREPTNIGRRPVQSWAERKAAGNITHAPDNGHSTGVGMAPNELGKLPGSVWTVATEPLNVPDHLGVDHFAAFPTAWPLRLIQGWSPAGICTACGEGRRPVTEKTVTDFAGYRATTAHRQQGTEGSRAGTMDRSGSPVFSHAATITGYACACPTPDAPTRPSVVLDPFGGTGTTSLCASVLGRIGISVDLSFDYARLAKWRVNDPGQRAKAMRVEKPPVQIDGQYDMFGGAA